MLSKAAKFIKKFEKQAKYLSAGLAAAAIEYGAFLIFAYPLKLEAWLAQVISFLIGVAVAFTLQATWTFKGNNQPKKARKQQFAMYLTLALINVVVTSIVMVILQRLGVFPWLAKIIVMGMVIVWNFAILNKLIFNEATGDWLSWTKWKLHIKNNYQTLLLFFLILAFGVAIIKVVPLGAGHDEYSHVIKADATSRLDFIPERHEFQDEQGEPEVIYRHKVSPALADFGALAYGTRNEDRTEKLLSELSEKANKKYNVESENYDAWGAAGYNWVAYLPNAVGLKIARVFNTNVDTAMYLSKVTGLITNAFIASAAFFVLRRQKVRYIIFFSALFLPAVAAFTAISANGVLVSLALFLTAFLLRSYAQKKPVSGVLWYSSLLAAIIIPLAKLPYLVLSLSVFTSRQFARYKKPIVAVVIFMAILLGGSLAWNYTVNGANEVQSQRVSCCSGEPADTGAQMAYILTNPIEYTGTLLHHLAMKTEYVNEVGRLTQQSSGLAHREATIAYLFILIVAGVLASSELNRSVSRRKVLYLTVILGVSVVGIVTALYVAANSVGQGFIWGVQPRYFLPLLPLAIVILARLFPASKVGGLPKNIFWYGLLATVFLNIIMLLGFTS